MNPVAPLVLAVFVASVLGSFHCAGMGGAFLALATGSPDQGAPGGWKTPAACQAAYHLGRLVTYVTPGVAAGAAGRLLNLAGALAGLCRAAAVLAGGTMIFFAAVAVLRARGVRVGRMNMPGPWARLIRRAHG